MKTIEAPSPRGGVRTTSVRVLSSAQTFVVKFVLPAVWIGYFGAQTIVLFLRPGAGAIDPKWLFLGVWILGGAFLLAVCARLKRLRTDGKTLWVSNFLREIALAPADVVKIDESRWSRIRTVTLRLARPTPFGDRIRFMPTLRWSGLDTPHPVVAQLEAIAADARRPGARREPENR